MAQLVKDPKTGLMTTQEALQMSVPREPLGRNFSSLNNSQVNQKETLSKKTRPLSDLLALGATIINPTVPQIVNKKIIETGMDMIKPPVKKQEVPQSPLLGAYISNPEDLKNYTENEIVRYNGKIYLKPGIQPKTTQSITPISNPIVPIQNQPQPQPQQQQNPGVQNNPYDLIKNGINEIKSNLQNSSNVSATTVNTQNANVNFADLNPVNNQQQQQQQVSQETDLEKLMKQRRALQLFALQKTAEILPEELRSLSPQQQMAISSGKYNSIENELNILNGAIENRVNQQKAEAQAAQEERKARLELLKTATADRYKQLEQVRSEANAFRAEAPVQNYQIQKNAYANMLESSKSGTGVSDIAMVFSFMKLLDPQSTVREGEFATAQNAGGVPASVQAWYNKLTSANGAAFLSAETRKEFLKTAENYYRTAENNYNNTVQQYTDRAINYGLPVDQIISADAKLTQYGYDTPQLRESMAYDMLIADPTLTQEEVEAELDLRLGSQKKNSSVMTNAGATLAVRNNNPGNLRFAGQQGATKGDSNFAKFETPEAGKKALINDLTAKITGRSITGLKPSNTLLELLKIYAPVEDNNDPVGYAKDIAQKIGVTVNTKIGTINVNDLAEAIASHEDKDAYRLFAGNGVWSGKFL